VSLLGAQAQPGGYLALNAAATEPVLFSGFSVTSYQLLTGSISVDKQKVLFAPFKLENTYHDVLSELVTNVAYDADRKRTSLGVGIGYNAMAPHGWRGTQIWNRLPSPKPPVSQQPGESDYDYHIRRTQELNAAADEVQGYYDALATNGWSVMIAANTELFSRIGGTALDVNGDGIQDNKYAQAQSDLSISGVYSFSPSAQISAAYHDTHQRLGPAANLVLQPYRGVSAALAFRTPWIFNPEYKQTKEWLTTGFVPALYSGVSVEASSCRAPVVALCADSTKTRQVYTPYLDFRLTPTSQFRIGVPIQHNSRQLAGNSTALSSIIQYSLQLATIPR
jgi:hypothetical protein